jgi:hypothetical protein
MLRAGISLYSYLYLLNIFNTLITDQGRDEYSANARRDKG